MYGHTLLYVLLMHSSSSLCLHITKSDLWPYLIIIMLAVSLVILGGHFTFVRGLYGDIWINILFHPLGKVKCIINCSCKIGVNMYLRSDIHCYNSKCISMYELCEQCNEFPLASSEILLRTTRLEPGDFHLLILKTHTITANFIISYTLF